MTLTHIVQYQALEFFYEGVNSRIYTAWDSENGIRVILKCFAPDRQDAYLREMSAAFGINHPHINRCVDAVYLQEEQRSCIVYEFIGGGSVRDCLHQHTRLTPDEVFHCLRDVLHALHYIHAKGFIHCDLKPENILLRGEINAAHNYLLSDLGAAASIKEAYTGSHTMSSPAYVAPERLYGRFTPSSDLYSLGVIGYELASGQRPFHGEVAHIIRAHVNETPDFTCIPHPYLRAFITRLMDKEPLQRGTAQQALQQLERFEEGATQLVDTAVAVAQTLQIAPPPVQVCAIDITATPDWQYTLGYRLDKLLVFTFKQGALLGLGNDNNLVLSVHPTKQAEFLLANTPQVKAQSAHSLVYAQRDGLFLLNLEQGKPYCVHRPGQALTAFDVRDKYVLWSSAENCHLYNAETDSQHTYRNQNYLLPPVLYLLEDGFFVSSESYMNQQLVLRDAHTEIIYTWMLDGPIVLCQEIGGVLLAITLSVDAQNRYTLWRLVRDQAVLKYRLPDDLAHYCATAAQIFWVTTQGKIYACDADFTPYTVAQLALARVDLFHISLDHRFIVAAYYQEEHAQIALWKNQHLQ
jgi:serine/threonine protein kinase